MERRATLVPADGHDDGGAAGSGSGNGHGPPPSLIITASNPYPNERTSLLGGSAAIPAFPPPLGAQRSSAPAPFTYHRSHHRSHHRHHHDDDDEEPPHVGCSIAALHEHINPEQPPPTNRLKPFVHLPYLPFLHYGREYTKKDAIRDLIAGIVVSVVAVPQGLAYSVLASLPAVMGLYTSAVPPLVYGFFGTSRQLSAGPVALVSMFIPTIAIQMRMQHDEGMRVAVACMASIVSGVLLMLIGVCKLGGLVKFISSPVLTGFTTASALVIGMSQFQHILGVPLPAFTYNYDVAAYLAQHLHETNPTSFVIGMATIAFLVSVRRLSRRRKDLPWLRHFNTVSTLVVLAVSTVASYLLIERGGYDFPIVGFVPGGSPHFSLAVPRAAVKDLAGLGDLIVACLPVTLLAFMSSWSLARKYATMFGQMDLDANQESFAIGVANTVAGCFGCFPSSGSFGRTTLNALNGARSPLSNLWAALAVLLCLWFFTPLLHYVPMSCLGGIIEASLASLFEYKPFKKAYRISKPDFVVMCVTAVTTALINIEVGLCVGIFVSIAVLLEELSEIRTSVMVPVPSAGGRYLMRSQSIDPFTTESETVKVIRLTASLFFANHEELQLAFSDLVAAAGDEIKAVVVDASGVSHLDLSGIEAVEFMHKTASEKGIKLVFANAKGVFRERLRKSKLWAKMHADEYQDKSVDEIVTALIFEQAEGTVAAAAALRGGARVHWGSPTTAGAPQSSSASLRAGGSGSGRGVCHTVAEGRPGEEEAEALAAGGCNGSGGDVEAGGGGIGGLASSSASSLSPPVFGSSMEGNVAVHGADRNGRRRQDPKK